MYIYVGMCRIGIYSSLGRMNLCTTADEPHLVFALFAWPLAFPIFLVAL